MAAFRHALRVRYQECDPQGVVYFARYPEYVDIALTELFREAIGSYQSMVDGGTDLVVAELRISYRGSARFDELIAVELAFTHLGETSLLGAFRVLRDGEEVLAEGETRHVFIDVATKAKRPMPDAIRAALSRYA